MSNVIKPEQLKSSKTPGAGYIPVINDSSELVIPEVIKSETQYLIVKNSIDNSSTSLVLYPNGTSTESGVIFRNSSGSGGYVLAKVIGDTFNISGDTDLGGTLPDKFKINGNIIYHAGNSGSGNGQDSDTVDGIHATTIVQTNDPKTITVQHTFNPSSAMAPFILGANAINQKITGLSPEKIWDTGSSTAVLATSSGSTSSVVPVINSSGALKINTELHLSGSVSYIKAINTISSLSFIVKNTSEYSVVITKPETITGSGATANIHASRIISTIAIGTAPFSITSTTKVTNLNSDMIDGYHISKGSLALGAINLAVTTTTNFDVTVIGATTQSTFSVQSPGNMSVHMVITTKCTTPGVVRVFLYNSSTTVNATVDVGTWYVTAII